MEIAENLFEAQQTGKLYLKDLPSHIHKSYITAYEMVKQQLNRSLNIQIFIPVNGQLEPTDTNISKRNIILYEIFRHRKFYEVIQYLWTYTLYHPDLFTDTTSDPGEHYSFEQVVRLSDPYRRGVCPVCGNRVPKTTTHYVDELKRRTNKK